MKLTHYSRCKAQLKEHIRIQATTALFFAETAYLRMFHLHLHLLHSLLCDLTKFN